MGRKPQIGKPQPNNRGKKQYVPVKKQGREISVGENPVEWYISNDRLAQDMASLPLNVMTGQKPGISFGALDSGEEWHVPGVLGIDYVSSPGLSTSSTSAINVASRAIYAWVRHQNSGRTNYEAVDLTLYILAMSEIYSLYAQLARALKLSMTYNLTNRYMPNVLLRAGFSQAVIDDLVRNVATYRGRLNLIASKIGTLAVPNHFTTFNRNDMLLSNVFQDVETERGQYYIFNLSKVRRFDPTHTNGGRLKTEMVNTGSSFNISLNQLNSLLEAVLQNEDMNIMSGDILKAYGREELFTLQGIDPEATISPIYDPMVLMQIENSSRVLKDLEDAVDYDIIQQEGSIIFRPKVTVRRDPVVRFLNYHTPEVTYKEHIEATRLTNAVIKDGEDLVISTGTELITYTKILTLKTGPNGSVTIEELGLPTFRVATYDTAIYSRVEYEELKAINLLPSFNQAPMIYQVIERNSKYTVFPPMGDLEKFAVVDNETVKNIHDIVLLAQYKTKLLSL